MENSRRKTEAETLAKELLKSKLPTKPGKHRDGAGLFLQIAAKGQASWTYQFRRQGETKWMSIGPAATFTLTEARKRHHELRRMRDRGIDPRSEVAAASLQPYQPNPLMAPAAPDAPERPASPLFGEVVELFLTDFAGDWAGGFEGKEIKSYRRTMITESSLAKLAVAEIRTEHVEAELKQWADKPVTAEKVLMRVGKILNYAAAKNFRSKEIPNPARIKGHFEFLARPVVPETVNHPAMKIPDVPGFMRELLSDGSTEARALAFMILTGPRTDESRLARWKEIEANVWTIPAERMKGKKKDRRAHSVPLVPAALKLLGKRGAPDEFIFPGRRYGARKPLWHSSFREVLNRLRGNRLSIEGLPPVPHGFRSTFRDWAAEAGFDRDLAERAIAHKVGDKTETAYQRSKLIEQRRPLMVAWAKFACGKA
jgi:integrase